MTDQPTPDAILEEAVGISDPEQRSAYLDQVCDGDSELRAEVESLVAAYCADASFLDTPAVPTS